MITKNNSLFNLLMEDVFNPLSDKVPSVHYPKSNVYETENGFEIQMELPGVKKSDISIEIDNKLLKISGERSYSSENLITKELYQGKFARRFRLPSTVEDDVSAKLENGVLKLSIAKREEEKPKRISIK